MTTEQMDWLDDERAGRHNEKPIGEVFDHTELHGMSTAQVTMREEMEQAKRPRTLADRNRDREPTKLGDVLDDELGRGNHTPQPVVNVQGLALTIIDDSPNLTLSLRQWQVVQGMVEAGIRTGMQLRG